MTSVKQGFGELENVAAHQQRLCKWQNPLLKRGSASGPHPLASFSLRSVTTGRGSFAVYFTWGDRRARARKTGSECRSHLTSRSTHCKIPRDFWQLLIRLVLQTKNPLMCNEKLSFSSYLPFLRLSFFLPSVHSFDSRYTLWNKTQSSIHCR